MMMTMTMRFALFVFFYAKAIQCAHYYLPGVTPNSYKDGDTLVLKANKVTSTKTPLQYDYYDLPFCKARKQKSRAENLGERLSGDSLTKSPYEIKTKVDQSCQILCRKV